MSWAKFERTHLTEAVSIQVVPQYKMPLVQYLTAESLNAPAILQWDDDNREPRNPASYYLYIGGSRPEDFNVPSHQPIDVIGISMHSAHFYEPDKFRHFGRDMRVLLLKDSYDRKAKNLALFPSFLKSELHEVRSTIENYNRTRAPLDRKSARGGAGVLISEKMTPITLLVTSRSGVTQITIDRSE